MITIVDYGMGNLRSVAKGFERLGIRARVTQDPKEVASASKLVLPGVGAFQDAISNLEQFHLMEPIRTFLEKKKPFLGICLGLQLLFTESEEGGLSRGFGVLNGRVRRFPEGPLKVPHIGWNSIRRTGESARGQGCPLLEGIPEGSYFYFVHSYYVDPVDTSMIAAQTDYGTPFTSIVWKENLIATQFHPEKSQQLGLKLLENFEKM